MDALNDYMGWSHMPWHFVDPTVYQRMPSFVLAEVVYTTNFLLGLGHALSLRDKRARHYHLLLWVAALLGGVGNDVFFTWLPVVDNFFHAQATFMLSPRFPLYIMFYYIGWLYFPAALIWRLKLPPLAEASGIALFACFYYYPWDVVGLRYLWWTWHDTDNTIQHRFLHGRYTLKSVPLRSSPLSPPRCFCSARCVDHVGACALFRVG
jgi:hypothetical protein